MESTGTLFVVREAEEYCFLYDRDDPVGLYDALFESAARPDMGLSREEVLEIIEGLVPASLRSV